MQPSEIAHQAAAFIELWQRTRTRFAADFEQTLACWAAGKGFTPEQAAEIRRAALQLDPEPAGMVLTDLEATPTPAGAGGASDE